MRCREDTERQAELCRRASSLAQRFGIKELSSILRLLDAVCEAEIGNEALGATEGECSALPRPTDGTRAVTAADVLARAGDASQSQKLMEQAGQGFSDRHLVNTVWLPIARAANQIRRQPSRTSR